jgi:hypothetical protein
MKTAGFIIFGEELNDGAWNAWGGLSLSVCDMKYRNKAVRMMVRSGAALMSGSGVNDGG